MLRQVSIKVRLTAVVVISLSALCALLMMYALSSASDIIDGSERSKLENTYLQIESSIEAEGRMGVVMASLVAEMPQVKNAYQTGQVDELTQTFVPGFKPLKSVFGVRQFQFHKPPAFSFLRVHKPAKRGDDLSSFRHTIVETHRSQQPVQGLESGVAGLGIRGVVPVMDGQAYLGSVEFGMSFGQAFLDSFKRKFGTDLRLHLVRNGEFKELGSTLGQTQVFTAEQLQHAFKGEAQWMRKEANDVPMAAFAHAINDYSGKPIGVIEIMIDRTLYLNQYNQLVMMMSISGIIAVALFGTIGWMSTCRSLKPLQKAIFSMEEFSTGNADLSARLDSSGQDEVSALARAFNQQMSKIHEVFDRVGSSAKQLDEASTSLEHSVQVSSSGAQHQLEEVESLADIAGDMASATQAIAESAAEANQMAQSANRFANQGRETVGTVIGEINVLAKEVSDATSVVKKVHDNSERISTVLDVIGDIAEQTNLLALNAAIEAARAGDQGRGFAVVAAEVRGLAKRTHDSTGEIQQMISELQQAVGDAVVVMERSDRSTDQSVQAATSAGESLDSITSEVDKILSKSTEIACASQQQSEGSERMSHNIQNIAQNADKQHVGVDEIKQVGESLSRQAGQLNNLVAGFHA